MDIQRKGVARRRFIKWILLVFIVAVAIGGAGLYVGRLQPAAPAVNRTSLWIDTVIRSTSR